MAQGTHKMWRHAGPKFRPTYKSWIAMLRRCADVKDHNYGGRGIYVCARWQDDFDAFVEDMGVRPLNMSLERINNNGHYMPENCRWATKRSQAHNRRTNRLLTQAGRTQPLALWADELGVNRITFRSYMERHSQEKAFERYLRQMEF